MKINFKTNLNYILIILTIILIIANIRLDIVRIKSNEKVENKLIEIKQLLREKALGN